MYIPVSYTHLRAHETEADLVCRLLLEKKKRKEKKREDLYIKETYFGENLIWRMVTSVT